MAIIHQNSGTVSYQGLVLATGIEKVDRVMSDIYASQWYALVWNPDTRSTEFVLTGSSFELCEVHLRAEVDATPETLATYQAFLAAQEAQKKAQQEREQAAVLRVEAQRAHDLPAYGKRMRVVRSYREARKGMEGIVFWRRDNRVGLRLSDERDEQGHWKHVLWTTASLLRNTEPPHFTP